MLHYTGLWLPLPACPHPGGASSWCSRCQEAGSSFGPPLQLGPETSSQAPATPSSVAASAGGGGGYLPPGQTRPSGGAGQTGLTHSTATGQPRRPRDEPREGGAGGGAWQRSTDGPGRGCPLPPFRILFGGTFSCPVCFRGRLDSAAPGRGGNWAGRCPALRPKVGEGGFVLLLSKPQPGLPRVLLPPCAMTRVSCPGARRFCGLVPLCPTQQHSCALTVKCCHS